MRSARLRAAAAVGGVEGSISTGPGRALLLGVLGLLLINVRDVTSSSHKLFYLLRSFFLFLPFLFFFFL